MPGFFETTFGPTELSIVEAAFKKWLADCALSKDMPEAELAAAIMINLFREGHVSGGTLAAAIAGHKGLADLKAVATLDNSHPHPERGK